MLRRFRIQIISVALLSMFLPCLAQAEGKQFYMLLRALPDTTARDVQLLLQGALNSVRDEGVKGEFLTPRPALPEVYYQMLEWMENITTDAAIQGGAIQIRRFSRGSTDWLLNLGIPDNSLLELTVQLEDPPGNTNLREEKFQVEVGPDAKLRYHSQGRYVITLPVNTRPVKYTVRIRDGRTGETTESGGDWQIPDSFFFVKFTSFEGDVRILYDALRKGNAGQKVEQIHEAQAIEIVLADFFPAGGLTGIFWQQNRMLVREPMPDGLGSVRRVWMQFPMSKAQAVERWSALSKLQRDEVSQKIRSEANVPFEDAVPVPLVPSYDAPTWYELAAVRDGSGKITHFERSFLFNEVEKWREITRGIDSAWRLVVFEFDDGMLQYALSVTHPVRNANTFVVDQEIPQWVIGVTERLQEGDVKEEEAKEGVN